MHFPTQLAAKGQPERDEYEQEDGFGVLRRHEQV